MSADGSRSGQTAAMRWTSVAAPIALVILFGVVPVCAADAPTLEDRAVAIERASTRPDGARVVLGHLSRELVHLRPEVLRVFRVAAHLERDEVILFVVRRHLVLGLHRGELLHLQRVGVRPRSAESSWWTTPGCRLCPARSPG